MNDHDEHPDLPDFGPICDETVALAVSQGAPILAMMYRVFRSEGLKVDEAAELAVKWYVASC